MMHTQLPLFPDIASLTPTTEGVKYAGSKAKLIPHILRLTQQTEAQTVLDGFSGTTRVSQAFAKAGYQVTSNDIAYWSETFATCYLMANRPRTEYDSLVDHLNHIEPMDGWFTENYGGYANDGCSIQEDGLKRPWQVHNTRKLDGIRQEIDALRLARDEHAVAITSLILALDRVDNTLGHHASYLRKWSRRSYDSLLLGTPQIFESDHRHTVSRRDVFDLIPTQAYDLAYLDPPYGSSNIKMPPSRVRYAAYYHLWTSVCLFDQPEVFGKARRRVDSSDSVMGSVFEEYRQNTDGTYIAALAMSELLRRVRAHWIIVSYSSGGRMTIDDLLGLIRKHGRLIEAIEVDHRRHVMAGMRWTNEWANATNTTNREWLFLMEKA